MTRPTREQIDAALRHESESTRQAVELAYQDGRGLDGLKGRL